MLSVVFAVLFATACTPEPLHLDTGGPVAAPEDSGEPPVDSDPGEVEDSDPVDTGDLDTGGEDTGVEDTGEPVTGHPTEPPPAPSYSGGACPVLTGGSTSDAGLNSGFVSAGVERQFRLLVPESYDGSTPMPLLFAWHWLNASSNSFVSQGDMERAVEELGFIAVFPDDIEDAYLFDWPFFEVWDAEQELTFFDDMLACVDQQYNIDLAQVHGIGVSAGALWLTYLSTTERVAHLASVMSLSGGLGDAYGIWSMEYVPQERKFPALTLSGGPTDWLGIDFYAATNSYRDALLDDGHFVVYCEHDAGHGMPPIEPPEPDMTLFYAFWRFMLDHPYGLEAGTSPYQETGLPDFYPEWCSIAG